MSIAQSRIVTWIAWFCVALASLVGPPKLLGMEPVLRSLRADRPRAVLLDVKSLPDEAIHQEVSTPSELQSLIPFEAEPEADKEVEAPAPAPPVSAADAEPVEKSLEAPDPKPALKADTVELLPLEVDLPGDVVPAPSQTSLKLVPQLETIPGETPAASPKTAPSDPVAAPVVGPAIKYWIVSSRCCPQCRHKCGINCRFLCHAVTEDCQCIPVEFETMIASQIPGAPTCILVHGSFTRLEDVGPDAECTYNWVRNGCPQAPINFIYYTWPSEGPFAVLPNNPFTTLVPVFDFGILGHRAEVNGFYVADLIGSLPPTTTVSLVGHSLGARTIAASLHLLGGGTVRGQPRWNPVDCGTRIRVVLAAAAIEHDWLNPGDRFGCALNRAECVLNLRNECDFALALYPLRKPFSSRALARSGFTKKDQRKLGERLVQVSELDVTPLIGKGHGWPNYCQQPGIAAAIAPYIFFESAAGPAIGPEMRVGTRLDTQRPAGL